MTRTIRTAAELDALPVGSVVVEGDHTTPDEGSFLGITTIPGVFHRFPDGWYVVAGYGARAPEEILPATVLHDPSAPAPAPSVVPEAAVGVLSEWGIDESDVAALREAEAAAWKLIDRTSDLADRAPRDETVQAALTAARAALPLPTAAPSATREEVTRAIRSVTDRWDEPLDEVHDVPPIADALLARFTITPKEDR